jgi:hypothetical protein
VIDECDFLIFGSKRCSSCPRDLPASTEYFAPSNQHAGGLTSQCRNCRNKRQRRYDIKRGRVAV